MNKRIAQSFGAAVLLSGGVALCSIAFAQTASDDAGAARSMLQKAVAAVKADETKAIDMICARSNAPRAGTATW